MHIFLRSQVGIGSEDLNQIACLDSLTESGEFWTPMQE